MASVASAPSGMEGKSLYLSDVRSSRHAYVTGFSGMPCSQYIDDRHLGELWGSTFKRISSFDAANCAFFMAATLLTQLGYFLHISKRVSTPTRRLIFLGHLVDTIRQTFSTPEDKKQKFIVLREEILSLAQVPLYMLQRFQWGKCICFPPRSFTLGRSHTLYHTAKGLERLSN